MLENMEDSTEPSTDELDLTASAPANGYIKSRTAKSC